MNLTSLRFLWLAASAGLYSILAYTIPRQQFGWLIGLLTGLFLGYGWVILTTLTSRSALWPARESKVPGSPSRILPGSGATDEGGPDRFLFVSAVLFRLLLLAAIPCLSDDVYRFVWDGRLLGNGFNPYLYLPSKILGTDVATVAGLDQALFTKLNSPAYFTVYPPLNQVLFGLAANLSGGSLLWNVIWLRLPIIVSEIGTMWLLVKLLRRLNMNPNLALLYSLNPLVILELTGNLHFEAVMIFFTLLAAWWILSNRWILSAAALALAVGTKLLPLLLLPLIVRWLGWRRGVMYALLVGLFTGIQFMPFASVTLVQNLSSSVNLYFQKFEFNASVYYILRAIGYWVKGYNVIGFVGFWLSVTTTLSILWISFRWRTVSIPNQVLAVLTLYLAFATTVHPWYSTTLVAASVFTRFRYPLLWTAVIPLSYFTYQTLPYQENLWLTAVEYTLVGGLLIFEILKSRAVMPER